MTEDEKFKLLDTIMHNPAFLQSLATCVENSKKDKPNLLTLAVWFFSQGYIACRESQEKSKMMRPYKYEIYPTENKELN